MANGEKDSRSSNKLLTFTGDAVVSWPERNEVLLLLDLDSAGDLSVSALYKYDSVDIEAPSVLDSKKEVPWEFEKSSEELSWDWELAMPSHMEKEPGRATKFLE